jgi:hypothetical protein
LNNYLIGYNHCHAKLEEHIKKQMWFKKIWMVIYDVQYTRRLLHLQVEGACAKNERDAFGARKVLLFPSSRS